MSRIAPLEPPCAPDSKKQFDHIMRGAPPLILFRVMAGHARAWEKLRAGNLLDGGPLSLREREIIIDRTCALNRCEYECGAHVAILAEAAQLTEEQVRATVLARADAPCWSEAEQAMIAAVDALPGARDAATPNSQGCRRITTTTGSWKSCCCAASTAQCRIWRTGCGFRWRKGRLGFPQLGHPCP